MTFGPIVVVNGRVAYNDRFVKPNYSANLSELSGRLAAFSSEPPGPGQPPQLADLELRGRVEGTATLDITGKVNPLAKPLALDLKAKVRDLELPPLSPYAIKYAGYGIERGKLSVDLAYVVQPDGQLTASNRIILNQLAFGDKVEGSTANLPVKLAVALLADRHGVIDLDLPVSGSINDPAVLARRRDLEGDHEPDRQGGDGAVRAARVGVRRRRARSCRGSSSRPASATLDAGARRRASTRSPRRSSTGRRCRSPSPARAGSRASATPGRRSGCASSFAPRSAARRSPAAPTRAPRSRSATRSIRCC